MVCVSHTKIAAKLRIKSTLWLFFKKKITTNGYRIKTNKNHIEIPSFCHNNETFFLLLRTCFSTKNRYLNSYVYQGSNNTERAGRLYPIP